MVKYFNIILGKDPYESNESYSPKIKKLKKKKKNVIKSNKKLKLQTDEDKGLIDPTPQIYNPVEEEKEEKELPKQDIDRFYDALNNEKDSELETYYSTTEMKDNDEKDIKGYGKKFTDLNNNIINSKIETINKIKDIDDNKILSISHYEIKKDNKVNIGNHAIYNKQLEDYNEIINIFEDNIKFLEDKIKNTKDKNEKEKYEKMKHEIGIQWRIYENVKNDYINENKKNFKSWQMSYASNIGHNNRLVNENMTLNQTIDNYKKTIHIYEQEKENFIKEMNKYEILDKDDKKIIIDFNNELKINKENLSSSDKEDLNKKNLILQEKITGIELANIALKAQIDISGKQLKNI